MNDSLNILLTSRDKAEISGIKSALGQNPGFRVESRLVTNGHFDPLQGTTKLPDVLLLGLSEHWQTELQELADRPADSRPPVIILAEDGNPEVMRLAMKAGARDYLTRPVDTRNLLSTLMDMAKEKSATESGGSKLTAFMNVKGGSGATLLAANTAHIMAEKQGKRVALVDLDIQFGTLALYLDSNPSVGVFDVLQDTSELDSVALQAYMVKHRSGVSILGAVHNQVSLTSEIPVSHLQQLIDLLTESYDHVILDLPRQIDAFTTTALERVDQIVLATQQGVTYLRDANRLRSILCDELGIAENRLIVAVNRFDTKNPVTLYDIEEALGSQSRILCVCNDYKRVRENVNLGIPLYEQGQTAAITKSVEALACALCPEQDRPAKKKGILTRVFG
jgi:pilus assembly protein CpaE